MTGEEFEHHGADVARCEGRVRDDEGLAGKMLECGEAEEMCRAELRRRRR